MEPFLLVTANLTCFDFNLIIPQKMAYCSDTEFVSVNKNTFLYYIGLPNKLMTTEIGSFFCSSKKNEGKPFFI